MNASRLFLSGLVAFGFVLASSESAVAQTDLNIDEGNTNRFLVYELAQEDAFVEANRTFLLDTFTGAVYTSVGSGEHWTLFANPHDVAAFPSGGAWAAPRFELAMASSADSEAKLVLTNTTSGAAYTRSPASGDWSPFRGLATP